MNIRVVIERDGYREVPSDDLHPGYVFPFSLGGEQLAGNLQVAHSRLKYPEGHRVVV